MNTEKIRWAILVTGWGRNAYDTIEAWSKGLFANSTIDLVVYEEEPCGAAEIAENLGVETLQLFKSDYSDLKVYQKELRDNILKRKIDYIFMLNYKYIIREDMLKAFPDRIINIHPSLFPSFLGTKTAIQDALEYGVKVTGITTHIIDEKLDEGVILCQTPIRIDDKDTFDSLYPKFAEEGKEIIKETINKIEVLHFQKAI